MGCSSAVNNGHLSFIYKLGQNDFLRTIADAVHAAHPSHLVGEQIVLEGADAVKEMLSGFVKGIRVFALFEENRRIIMDCITDGIGVEFALFTVAFTPQTTSVEWDAYIGLAWYET